MGIQEFQSDRRVARERGNHSCCPAAADLRSLRNLQLHPGRDIHLGDRLPDRHVQLYPQLQPAGIHWLQLLFDPEPERATQRRAKECRVEEAAKHHPHSGDILHHANYNGDGTLCQAASAA